MRNILEYPITYQESIKTLEELRDTIVYNSYGDMRPTILDWVITALKELDKHEDPVVISQDRYNQLVESEDFLDALYSAGVDNWEGYEFAQESLES